MVYLDEGVVNDEECCRSSAPGLDDLAMLGESAPERYRLGVEGVDDRASISA